MTLVLLIAAGVVLGLLALWGIFAGGRAINGNENLQTVLCAIALGLGLWWYCSMGYRVFPIPGF